MGPPPLGFSQVLILNAVKVLCFDTLLQVLILRNFYWSNIVQNAGVARKGPPGKAPESKNASRMLALRGLGRSITHRLWYVTSNRLSRKDGAITPIR